MTDSSEFTYDGWPTTGAVRGVVISSRAKIVGEDQAAAEFDGWLADFEQNVRSDEREKALREMGSADRWLTGRFVDPDMRKAWQDAHGITCESPTNDPDACVAVAHVHGCRLPPDHEGACLSDTPHRFSPDGCEHCGR